MWGETRFATVVATGPMSDVSYALVSLAIELVIPDCFALPIKRGQTELETPFPHQQVRGRRSLSSVIRAVVPTGGEVGAGRGIWKCKRHDHAGD